MKSNHAFILLEFVEENWERFELKCKEVDSESDPEELYQELQREALQ